MSEGPAKLFIRIEPDPDQKNAVKNSRKTLKVLQKTADKENLIGRQPFLNAKDKLAKSEEPIEIKRVKVTSQSSQTEDAPTISTCKEVSVDDLTTDKPNEIYWEILAEKRREALEETLVENKLLHEKVESLEDELNTSRKMLEETRNLVEVLTEMLKESEEEADEITSTAVQEEDEDSVEEEESQL